MRIAELESLSGDHLVEIMTSTIQAILFVAVALLVIYVSRKLSTPKNLPPGPTPWPIIGSLHLLGTHAHKSLADLARQYGPVMSVQLGQKLCIVATSPDAAKEFLKIQDANFSSRPTLRAAQLLLPNDVLFNRITPTMRHLRKILVTELMTVKRLEASKHMRKDEIAYMLRTICKAAPKGPIQVSPFSEKMSMNLTTRIVFGKRLGGTMENMNDEPTHAISTSTSTSGVESAADDVRELLDIVKQLAPCFAAVHPQDYFNFVPTWFDPQGCDTRFRKLATRMDAFTSKMINQHKEKRRKNPISDGKKNLLDALLEQLDNPEVEVTERHVRSVLWDALVGTTETSSLTVEWVISEVLLNPALGERARSEIDRVVGLERTVEEADIVNLPYVQAMVKESLRLHPPVPLMIPHQNVTAAKAFGYNIPAKTTLYVNVWSISRDPAIWQKPLEFRPERFMEGEEHAATEFQGQHFQYTPFGSGRRICPGVTFASISVTLQLASLLHAFDWSLLAGMTREQLDMTEGSGLSLRKQVPLLATATPRLPLHLY